MTKTETPKEFDGRLASGKDWREIVAWVGDLPPMPHVASRAIRMVEDPDTTAPDLTELLSSDTALAARVLKIANSAMFSRQREITTLNQAIMIIGFKALKGVIVAATLRQLNKNFGNFEKMIWENSMFSAQCATKIARKLRKRYFEEIFLLGLLHSLGQIVFLAQKDTANDYRKVLDIVTSSSIDYVTAEQEVFGFTHTLIGALVAKKWNFPPDTCQVILHYKDPLESPKPESEIEEKTAIVHLSDLIAHNAGVGSPEGYPHQPEMIKELAVYLGFPEATAASEMEKLQTEAFQQFDQEKHIYS